MIELRHVHFAYGTQPVLRDVSFLVDDSEAVVIMGPSGSGKSTILRLILGLDSPQEGEVLVDYNDVCRMRQKELREVRKKIGMVFQDGALFDSLTVGENVGYYLIEHTKLKWDEIEHRARTMLGFVGLEADEVIDKLPDQLSGGMRRRVAIGRALLSTDPKIMLNASFARKMPAEGRIAFLSQSGALCTAVLDYARETSLISSTSCTGSDLSRPSW